MPKKLRGGADDKTVLYYTVLIVAVLSLLHAVMGKKYYFLGTFGLIAVVTHLLTKDKSVSLIAALAGAWLISYIRREGMENSEKKEDDKQENKEEATVAV